MNKIDLHLIGNSIVDEIFEVQRSAEAYIPGSSNTYSSRRTCYGGLGNLLLVLKKSGLTFHVSTHVGRDGNGNKLKSYFLSNGINYTSYPLKETSSALILSERISGFQDSAHEKTSFVKWGSVSCFSNFKPVKAVWAHISYLDVLHGLDLSKLRKHYDYISADLCLNSPKKSVIKKVVKNLKYLDFLFMSTNEWKTYADSSTRRPGKLTIPEILTDWLEENKSKTQVVVHSPYWAAVCSRFEVPITVEDLKVLEGVSVVGAGDKFCAYFINKLLSLKKVDEGNQYFVGKSIRRSALAEALLTAVTSTPRILGQNEEI